MMPVSFIYDAEYWRKRAQEIRTLADSLKDQKSKQTMLSIVDDYDRRVAHAEERATPKPPRLPARRVARLRPLISIKG